MAERLYNLRQVANLLGASPAEVKQWLARGWIQADRLPDGSQCVSEGALVKFLRDRGVNLEELVLRSLRQEAFDEPADATAHQPSGETAQAPAATPAITARLVIEAVLRDALRRGARAVHLRRESDGLVLGLEIGGRLFAKPRFKTALPPAVAACLVDELVSLAVAGTSGVAAPGPWECTLPLDGGRVAARVELLTGNAGTGAGAVIRLRSGA